MWIVNTETRTDRKNGPRADSKEREEDEEQTRDRRTDPESKSRISKVSTISNNLVKQWN